MPKLWLDVHDQDALVFDPEQVVVKGSDAWLCSFDSAGNPEVVNPRFGFNATYAEFGILELRRVKLTDLAEFFSMEAESEEESDSAVGYQLNVGAGWIFFDGLDWVAAGVLDWNVVEDVNMGLSLKPIKPSEIGVRVRLAASTDRKTTPVFHDVALGLEFSTNFHEDIVRSVVAFIKSQARPKQRVTITVSADGDEVQIQHDFKRFKSCEWVYNLTTDPARTTNLFASVSGNTVSLTDDVAEDDVLDIMLVGDCDVISGPQDEDYVKTHEPIYVVALTGSERYRPAGRPMGTEVIFNPWIMKSRVRREPQWTDVDVSAYCVSKYPVVALAMVDALEALFGEDVHESLWSVGTGELLDVVEFDPMVVEDRISEGLYERVAVFKVSGKKWDQQFREAPVMQELEMVGNPGTVEEEIDQIENEGG